MTSHGNYTNSLWALFSHDNNPFSFFPLEWEDGTPEITSFFLSVFSVPLSGFDRHELGWKEHILRQRGLGGFTGR